MKRFFCVTVGVLWVGGVCGCTPSGVLAELPDPLFGTVRPVRVCKTLSVELPAVVKLPSPRPSHTMELGWIPPGGVSRRWACMVIHHSAGEVGGAEAFDRFHRNVRKWDELGYHFVIGNGSNTANGEIEVGSRWTKQKHGAHCKTPDQHYNYHGIGICLVGDFTHHPPSAAQMDSLARLVGFLMEECDIDISQVLTHRGVTHRTECPGACFSLDALKARLK
ncbi:MAG: N-acetylmuramoyl-L-alanine amidase [Phycisphaerae bacterium]|nr:N-acetylmuramoyl-L-alanine amidase [Phycisphaerae bacterium]